MKKRLPEWIVSLMPIALLCTLINMFVFYLLSYWISRNGITTTETYLFLIIPTILFFIVTALVCYFALKQYRLDCFANNVKPFAAWLVVPLLTLAIFFLGFVADWIYFQIDPYLSLDFGQALENVLIEAGESRDVVEPIAALPLYTQNYIGVIIGIFLGTMLSAIMVNMRIKKPAEPSLG